MKAKKQEKGIKVRLNLIGGLGSKARLNLIGGLDTDETKIDYCWLTEFS